MPLNEPTSEFLLKLARITDCDTPTARYLEEPRGRYVGQGAVVVRPRSVREVSEIMRLCNTHKIGVVPFGGGTGLVGGQTLVTGPKPVILSLEWMNSIRDVDPADNILTTESGVILADIQNAANDVRRLFPLSLASEGSCQIGGNLATNAGGVNVLRYGNTRDLCLGIEAVLPDGSIFGGLKRLRKDNTGYNLRNLLIGAEGTLGIITAATLRLMPKPVDVETAFLAIPNPQASVEILNQLSTKLGEVVSAFELIHRQGLDFLNETGIAFTKPLSSNTEWMVLLECGTGGNSGLKDNLEGILADAFDAGLITDAVLAQNEAQRHAFWNIRESIPEANRRIGVISSHDISVPVSQVPDFIARAAKMIKAINPQLRINCFGHLGDGNLHYNIYPPKGENRSQYDDIRAALANDVYELVDSFGGSFSAEHGVGRMKKADLLKYSDPAKLSAMRAIKHALDPNGIMNPGAVI
ncbi:MAG: hydroxyacid dehydrogenase [Rhodobacteraceae bacterium]|nr:MAG: hydroxyacid dehydrogenase [Paracoccaceae bacterium]